MKNFIKRILFFFKIFGVDLLHIFRSVKSVPFYLSSYMALKTQEKKTNHQFKIRMNYPCLNDRATNSGVANGHYFHQDLYIASCIFKDNPKRHIDIGSRVDGFVAHVASYRNIEVFDVRPLVSAHSNIIFNQLDLTCDLPTEYVECTDSLSCLHAIEHIGLGRYGDVIDYMGHITALSNLVKMLEPNGKLYLSAPIGPQRIEFNAHRVFSVSYFYNMLKNEGLVVKNTSVVNDSGDFLSGVNIDDGFINNFGCKYGCIIFETSKIK
jgi:hypothetical protein